MEISRETAERIHSQLMEAQKLAAEGSPVRAREICFAALEKCPTHPDTNQILGILLQQEGNLQAAIKHLSRSVEVFPDQPQVLARLGAVYHETGESKKATAALRKALDRQPGDSRSWRLLAEVEETDKLAELAETVLQRLFDDPEIEAEPRLQLLFALAKTYGQRGQWQRAIDFAAIAKYIQEQIAPDWRENLKNMFAATKEQFSENLLKTQAKGFSERPVPVFVVGLPRSGGRAVEAILAEAKGVYAAGEARAMAQVMAALSQKRSGEAFPANAADLTPEDLTDLGKVYLGSFPALPYGTTHVIDRLPANLHVLGLVRMMFPHAKVIHARRNPLDACLSIFTDYFPEAAHPQLASLSGIGDYARLADDLMAFWKQRMPGFIHDVDHHGLATEPGPAMRGLYEFCGLKPPAKTGKLPKAATLRLHPEGLGKKHAARLWPFEEAYHGKAPLGEKDVAKIREDLARARKVLVEDNLSRARKIADRVLEAHPHQADAMQVKALIAAKQNEFDPAAGWYRKSLDAAPIQPSVWIKLGNIHIAARNPDQAAYAFTMALMLDPKNVEALMLLGSLRLAAGAEEQAKQLLERAVAADPGYAPAYNFLTQIKGYALSEEQLAKLEAAASAEKENLERAVSAEFVLASHYRKSDEREKFLHHIERANRLQAGLTIKPARFNHVFSESLKRFTRDFVEDDLPAGGKKPVPIFIVGLPRSGSTLTEQILGSHPKVFPGDEIRVLGSHLVAPTEKEKGEIYPESLFHRSKHELEQIREKYLARMREVSDTDSFITDKMLSNAFYLGIIRKCLPFAKVIYTRRNLMDTAFSIYTNPFSETLSYTYNFEEMAAYARMTVDIMRFWQELMPGFMLEVDYEKLVANPEKQVRRLLDFCGLEWEPKCLEFYKTRRPALTLSITQVQKPIYKTSIEKWKEYAELMEPFRKGVEDLIDEDGFLKG